MRMKLVSIVGKLTSISQKLPESAQNVLGNLWNKVSPEFWRITDTVSHRLLISESVQTFICNQYDLTLARHI